jgi:ABC-type transport system substrate-binding protein
MIDHSKNKDLLQLTATLKAAKAQIESTAYLPTMDEAIFKQFLPLLTSPVPVDLGPWMQVVGVPTQWVVVTRNGEEIYRVPPLANTRLRTTTQHSNRNNSIGIKIGQVVAKSNRIPALHNQIIADELSDSMPHLGIDLEHLAQWNLVLKENGYPPLNETTASEILSPSAGNKNNVGSLNDEDIEEFIET